jgi:hypothetical protein
MLFSFTNPNWRPFSLEKCDALRVSPNQLWANPSSNAGALVVKKSRRYAEYAVSDAGLNYLHAAVKAGKIISGFVVLASWSGGELTVVQSQPVAEVVAALHGIPPRDGPFGAYWWVNPDGTLNGPRPLSDEETPF